MLNPVISLTGWFLICQELLHDYEDSLPHQQCVDGTARQQRDDNRLLSCSMRKEYYSPFLETC